MAPTLVTIAELRDVFCNICRYMSSVYLRFLCENMSTDIIIAFTFKSCFVKLLVLLRKYDIILPMKQRDYC